MTESVAWTLIGFCFLGGALGAWTVWHVHTLYSRLKDLEDQVHADFGYLYSASGRLRGRVGRLESEADDPHGTRHITGERGDEYGIG